MPEESPQNVENNRPITPGQDQPFLREIQQYISDPVNRVSFIAGALNGAMVPLSRQLMLNALTSENPYQTFQVGSDIRGIRVALAHISIHAAQAFYLDSASPGWGAYLAGYAVGSLGTRFLLGIGSSIDQNQIKNLRFQGEQPYPPREIANAFARFEPLASRSIFDAWSFISRALVNVTYSSRLRNQALNATAQVAADARTQASSAIKYFSPTPRLSKTVEQYLPDGMTAEEKNKIMKQWRAFEKMDGAKDFAYVLHWVEDTPPFQFDPEKYQQEIREIVSHLSNNPDEVPQFFFYKPGT